MTVEGIKNLDREMLTPADVADILGSDPQTIRMTARKYPERIGYPFTFTGSRMKIPRVAFLKWFMGEK